MHDAPLVQRATVAVVCLDQEEEEEEADGESIITPTERKGIMHTNISRCENASSSSSAMH